MDRIIDELPERGAESGDYMQYVPGSTEWDILNYDIFAADGFESGGGSGGTGNWTGYWTLSGSYYINYGGAPEGSRYLWLYGDDNETPGDGYAQREVDLSDATGPGPYLQFEARIDSFESYHNDEAYVKVSANGTDWDILQTFTSADNDYNYHQYRYDLSSYGGSSSFYVAFETQLNSNWDYFYIDDIEFNNYDGTATGEWPMPPFDPTDDGTSGSGSDYYQWLEWDFEDAGYDDIDFEYGEVRTMSFQAIAALEEGTYCNKIWVSSESWGDEGAITSGTTAKIIVGDPYDTRCSGGLVEVNKESDPEVVYPYEETTVTYTITIENVDTIDVRIYEIEDWLPATGSTLPEEGFIYVDNSAHGRIIRPTSIAYDGLEGGISGGTGDWSDNWTLSGDYFFSTSGEHSGTYHMMLLGDSNEYPGPGYAQRGVDLSGYSDAELRFYAKAELST
ncbi:choice-of-anchor J domain-containing protein [Chloroflexota bacterium]